MDPRDTSSSQASRFDFPAFVERIRAGLALTMDGAPGDPSDQLAAAESLLEQVWQSCQPLPDRLRRDADKVRRCLDEMEALVSGRLTPSGPRPLFHGFVYGLLWMNYQHAVAQAGRDATDAELRAIVKEITGRRKGRPLGIPLAVVQQAKELRNQGQSYGRIARKLPFKDAQSVRSALEHHFPSASTQKKSR